jgi:hypothetical protein
MTAKTSVIKTCPSSCKQNFLAEYLLRNVGLLLFLLLPVFIGAQETEVSDAQTIFYIRDIDFDIKGHTRPFALLYNSELKKGESFLSKSELERYLKNKVQLLKNQRTLESADITYTMGEVDGNGKVPVDLVVHTIDTTNFIILPEPKYSSSDGFDIELKARDYNFLGTLTPLRFDLGYALGADDLWDWEKGSFKFSIDSDTPFGAFGYNWNFNFDHDFRYTFGEPLYYQNITGISMELPWKQTLFNFSFEERFIFNEENSTAFQEKFGQYTFFYMSSELYTSWKIPLGITIGEFGGLSYVPKLSSKIDYKPGGIDELRRGLTGILSHSFEFGQVNWIGNYRDGLRASVSSSNAFNFYRKDWTINYTVASASYKYLADLFGISGRVQFKQWFFTNNFLDGLYPATSSVGDLLRGIKNNSVIAENKDFLLSMNVDFPIRILHFVPSEWFHIRELRYINFDLHFSPFIDIMLLEGFKDVSWSNGVMTRWENSHFFVPLVSAGVEFIVFPLMWRSLYVRASFGYDINKLIRTGDMPKWDEIFIGVGHQY